MPGPDRLNALTSQDVVTGLDFVYVHEDQVTLDIFFLTPPLALTAPLSDLTVDQILISDDSGEDVIPASIVWDSSDGRDVLQLSVVEPGNFQIHRLYIDDPRIDPHFNNIRFSFKANCPSDLDCKPEPNICPPEDGVDFPVDGLARDFWSYRRALFDFAAQRYPHWKDRLEADVGVMLAELMSAAGDEMAHYQDRIAREGSLESATQRRSLRRHARLVDYVVHDGLGASAWLDVRVRAELVGPQLLPAGSDVWAESDHGRIISFEVGRGLEEVIAGETYPVDAALNELAPHIWDENAVCLPIGATGAHLNGHHAALFPPGKKILLATNPADPSKPLRRWIVTIASATNELDPLAVVYSGVTEVTRLVWADSEALPFELDQSEMSVHGNIVPATAGRTEVRRFSTGATSLDVERAVERVGPNGSIAYLYSLPDGAGEGLVWLGKEPRSSRPEVRVAEVSPTGDAWIEDDVWSWRRSLLGTESSGPEDLHYTLDDGTWARAVGYHRSGVEIVHRDYLTGAGTTIRFGDGEFGASPPDGRIFQVHYRLGNGLKSNVARGAINRVDPALTFVERVENVLPANGGVDAESAEDVKKLAPEAYRSLVFRAVRPEDYAEAAERLEWIDRAGATLRWTGSWLSMYVTADPKNMTALSTARRAELVDHLDRFRQAGRDVAVLAPKYADLDMAIEICLEPFAYRGEVLEQVRAALVGGETRAFFHADNFQFGSPLERSKLERTVQSVPGVRAVRSISMRRRGYFGWRIFEELTYKPGPNEIIRLENDRDHPDRGTLRLVTEGGA